nr:hypothetical protein [uncultured Cohaesibacter sp.]
MRSTYLDLLDGHGSDDLTPEVVISGRFSRRAVTHFELLLNARVQKVLPFHVLISYEQSGLGNRKRKVFEFETPEACTSFVDQIAQRAVESRGRRC